MNTQEFGKFVAYKDAALILPFIEGRGLPHDFSRNKINCSVENMKWLANSSYFFGYSLPSFVSCGNSELFDFSNKQFTIIVKTKCDGDISSLRDTEVLGKEPSSGSLYEAYSFGPLGGKWRIVARDETGVAHTSTAPAKDWIWFLWCYIWDGSAALLYKNKQRVTGMPLSTLLKTTGNLDIAKTKTKYYRGFVSFVSIYSRSFKETEVKSVDYYLNSKPKPTAITKRGCFQAVKNTGVEVDGKLTSCCGI